MNKIVKAVLWISAIFIMIVVSAGIYGYIQIRKSLPEREGIIRISTLSDSVEITFDKMGIPQIWAADEHDGYFALGYLHASDRLFQMDMTRRVAQGRLADLLGPSVLAIDIHQRTVGHDRIAKRFLATLSSDNRRRLQAYSDGVNAYIKKVGALPFEFQLLRKKVQSWSVYDCLTILSFQSWFSDYLMSPDAFMVHAAEKEGKGLLKSLDVPYPLWAPYTIPTRNKTKLSLRKMFQKAVIQTYFADQDLPLRMANSSNSWVIGPAHSVSGSAMLASDPHLEIRRLPQFWYYLGLHIKDPSIHVLGISTPGLPLIVMGHNGQCAWAFTVSGIDVNEYYIEKVHPEDSSRYLTPTGWQPFKTYAQEIEISGAKQPYHFTVKETRHGPLVFENDSLKQHYALHWAGFDTNLDTAMSAGFRLMRISSYDQFRKTVTRLGALDASWTYADAKGNIGYQLGTPVAIRPDNPYNLPVPGWSDEYQWHGFLTLDETPHSLNPEKGWLAVSNNKPEAKSTYPLYGNYASDRILRITRLLESAQKFSVQDMYRFQMDITDAFQLHLKDEILRLLKVTGHRAEAEKMSKWEGVASVDSWDAAVVNEFLNRLKHLTFDDELGGTDKKILYTDLMEIYFHGPRQWFDDVRTKEKVETREEIARKAINEALQIVGDKTWGDFHTLSIRHPLAVVPVVSGLLHLQYGPFPWPGTAGTLNAAFYLEDKANPNHFKSIVGPSWRFVIDFSNVDAATMVLPAGNSGNPLSEHFMDFFEMWKNGLRWNVPLSYQKVRKKAVQVLYLQP